MLYGVEIWGWRNKEPLKRLQARYIKMALGINRNTPAYIWRKEAGCRGIAVELWERAARYIEEVMRMDDSRWPKKCLKEEVRGIINADVTKWGKELNEATERRGNMEYNKEWR